MAEPAPPCRIDRARRPRFRAVRSVLPPGRSTVTGWRNPSPVIFGWKPSLNTRPGRPPRQNGTERRAGETQRRGKGRPGGIEHRAALDDIVDDVAEIDHRQNAAPVIAVEDDQIEFRQIGREQLVGRERDQRQFAHRRHVLLVGRPQDGEMHEIDRRIGLQQVAPGPQTRIGLARDQHHPQTIAHAIDHRDRAIVLQRQFLFAGIDLDLERADAGML